MKEEMATYGVYHNELNSFLVVDTDGEILGFKDLESDGYDKYLMVALNAKTQVLSAMFHKFVLDFIEKAGELNVSVITLVPFVRVGEAIDFDFLSTIPLSDIIVVNHPIFDAGGFDE